MTSPEAQAPKYPIALNTQHPDCHEAADAFWEYWKANGETHRHGYYESTWGAINRAIRMVGVVPHDYGVPGLLAASPQGAPSPAARDVLAERQRQIQREGWTPEHDDEHCRGELAQAAACYAIGSVGCTSGTTMLWPWAMNDWKPKGERRDLIRAAALIIAEIERLDRAAMKGQPS